MNLQETYVKIERKILAECRRMGDQIPYVPVNGSYVDMRDENRSFWTNGFWAGLLWQLYHSSGNPVYRDTARHSEESFDRALSEFEDLHHDVGFQFLHTAVADYRLTGNPKSRVRGLHAAALLAGRYNPTGEYIRAWNKDMPGWMIIDCLMNLPLLYWAGEEMGDPRYADIANRHTHTALRYLMREDGSCNHIAIFHPSTGEVLNYPAGQGYASGSSWSRGQAWALYGFALAFVHTGKQEYLDAAKRSAHYFIANTALSGFVSRCDFRSPQEPMYLDTTATACAACGLLQITDLVPECEKLMYHNAAVAMLEALEERHCNWNPDEDGILQDGTVAYGRQEETHIPIIYGDYFFVEGILRLMKKDFLIW